VVEGRGSEPVGVTMNRDIDPVPITQLAAEADLIVYGKLARPKSYLSDDKRDIYTDFALTPHQIVADRALATTRKSPGALRPITVTILGGELMVDGIPVRYDDMSRIKGNENASVLVFLRKTGDVSRFELCGDTAGLFEVDSSHRVTSLLKHPYKDKDVTGQSLERIAQKAREAFAKR
jgi:hypothetical protein